MLGLKVMMRAWAAIVAAVVLVACPGTVAYASTELAQQDLVTPVAGVAPTVQAAAGSLGVMLWLAVAAVAILSALVMLRHSRSQSDGQPHGATGSAASPGGFTGVQHGGAPWL